MSGRARGRGVARGRGAPVTPAAADAARRPGNAPVPSQAPVAAQAAAAPTNGNGGNGAGRASHRGGARGEPRPGAGVPVPPSAQLAQMSLGTGDAQPRRERREISYNEPKTKPAHIVDKRGSSGVKIQLLSNYFQIISTPGWQMYHYYVDFNPPIDSRKLRKGLMYEHSQKLFPSNLFDGMQLYSPKKLPDEVTELFSIRKYDEEKIRITIKRVAELAPNSPTCINILNIMMRQILSDLGMKEVQRAYYSASNAITLKAHSLEVWPGFRTSILQYERSIMLNIDVSHKVLRTDSVLDSMYRIYDQCRGNLAMFKDRVMKELIGEIVLTRYNSKTYRVDDIEWDIHPSMSFKRRDEEINYKDYYMKAYNVEVKDMQQPMLVSRPKKKDQREGAPEMLYLLPELCTRTGLTDQMRENFTIMKDLGVHTRVEPTQRANTMRKFRSDIQSNEEVQKRLDGWQVKYSDNLVQLEARVVPQEKILLGAVGGGSVPRTVPTGVQADWGNALRGKMYTTVSLNNWVIVYFNRNEPNVQNFLDSLSKVAPPLGMAVNQPKKVVLQNQTTSAFMDAIKTNLDASVQMMVIVLPSNKKELYDAVKKQCCVETPVPSQCITNNILGKPRGLMSVVTKIAVQLNCKLGGEAWAVEIPLKKAMVVGIDTYHDSAKKGRSVGGFVASLNGSMTRYFSQTIFQSSMQELIDGLKVSMAAALKKYHAINNFLPERIIVYRDGVGDGQLAVVVDHEVSQITEAIKMLGASYNPYVSVVVVKKRINSRFFAKGQGGPNSLRNPDPGTIIDDTVTRAESYDFFLISQSVRQGTVTPTHYNIIWDTSQLKPDHMQRLTYKLCHLYYNWPGTIRVPAPCQYAHKLAFLTGQSLHRSPHMALADKLYYL